MVRKKSETFLVANVRLCGDGTGTFLVKFTERDLQACGTVEQLLEEVVLGFFGGAWVSVSDTCVCLGTSAHCELKRPRSDGAFMFGVSGRRKRAAAFAKASELFDVDPVVGEAAEE